MPLLGVGITMAALVISSLWFLPRFLFMPRVSSNAFTDALLGVVEAELAAGL